MATDLQLRIVTSSKALTGVMVMPGPQPRRETQMYILCVVCKLKRSAK